ncbi:type II toxin-antitoxin system RelE/ParE family toxin [Nocardia tengchongensis]|uniref:type II toxin-antitoxin system RelE/ParE family toxin n=1 Tax=Nocardia tengchongensis TaxID=2055889 RepID=UPI00360A8A95
MPLFELIAEPEVVDFLVHLNPTDRAHADFAASLLAEFGTTLSEPYSKYLGDGVRELRFTISNGAAVRITYWLPGGPLAILLTVFTKTRQREIREVDRAKLAKKVCETDHDRTYHNVFTL